MSKNILWCCWLIFVQPYVLMEMQEFGLRNQIGGKSCRLAWGWSSGMHGSINGLQISGSGVDVLINWLQVGLQVQRRQLIGVL